MALFPISPGYLHQKVRKVAHFYFQNIPQHIPANSVESVHNRIAGEAVRDKLLNGMNPGRPLNGPAE
jgi:hypothetical protein